MPRKKLKLPSLAETGQRGYTTTYYSRNRVMALPMIDRNRLALFFSTTLLAGATLVSGAATNSAPWHVSNAELRAPVMVDVRAALLRMPPQVYVADLKPLEITGGLAFDPQTKGAIPRDVRKPEEKAAAIAREKERYKKAKTKWDPKAYNRLGVDKGGPIMRITGSATYAIEPGYTYFSWRSPNRYYNHAKITIDGKRVSEENLLKVTINPHHNLEDSQLARLAPIPPGAKTLKIEMLKGEMFKGEGRWSTKIRQAGFITRNPRGQGGQFAHFGQPRTPNVEWLGPQEGPRRLADGFESFPVELYTSEACDERGMNYACYEGSWEKLPDFDALKPVKQGVLRHFDREHLNGVLLPYDKITKKDGKDHRTTHPSALKLTGYLKVKEAGDYTFSWQSVDRGRLAIGSKIVIDSEAQENPRAAVEVKHGTVHLEPGVHPVTLTYLNTRNQGLNVTFPRAFVRSLTIMDLRWTRLMAGALLAQGKPGEAKSLLLTTLQRGGWPLSERQQYDVEQTRMRIRRLATSAERYDHSYALDLIESSLNKYAMLCLDPEFMVSAIDVYATLRDPRAAILAEQMLAAEMNEGQRRLLILTQVKVKLNEGDLPAAGKVYKKLKKLAPQSDELIEARELIRAAVIKKGKK